VKIQTTIICLLSFIGIAGCIRTVPISVESAQLLPEEIALSFLQKNTFIDTRQPFTFMITGYQCRLEVEGASGGHFDTDGIVPYRNLEVCVQTTPEGLNNIFLTQGSCWGMSTCIVYYAYAQSENHVRKIVTALISLGAKQAE